MITHSFSGVNNPSRVIPRICTDGNSFGWFASLVLNNTKLDCAAEIANEVAHVAGQIIWKFYSSRVTCEICIQGNEWGWSSHLHWHRRRRSYGFPNHMPSLPTPFMVRRSIRLNRDNVLLPDLFIWILDPIDGTSSFVKRYVHLKY